MPAHIALKPNVLDELDADARRLLDAAAELGNAAEQLLGIIPPEVNPVLVTRDRLAALQAARDAFIDAGQDVLEVRELDVERRGPIEAPAREPGGALLGALKSDGLRAPR